MTTVSGSLAAKGVSKGMAFGNISEQVSYSVTGTFVGTWTIERAKSPEGKAWESVLAFNNTRPGSGVYQARPKDLLRFRVLSHTSGTVNYSLSDGDAQTGIAYDADGRVIWRATQSTFFIPGNLEVAGTAVAEGVTSAQAVLAHGVIASGALEINSDIARVHTATLGQAMTLITLSTSMAAGLHRSVLLYLFQDGVGSREFTAPANWWWQGGFAPSLVTAAGGVDIIQVMTVDGGATWIAGISYSSLEPHP